MINISDKENIFEFVLNNLQDEINRCRSNDYSIVNQLTNVNPLVEKEYPAKEIISSNSYYSDDIDKFITQYRDKIEEIRKKYVINRAKTFEEEIQIFYNEILTIRTEIENTFSKAIHKLFLGLCLYFMPNKQNDSFVLLSEVRYMNNELKTKIIDEVIEDVLQTILNYNNKERVLVLISEDDDEDERNYDRPMVQNLLLNGIKPENILVEYKYAIKYQEKKSILIETLAYDYVFFIGHGSDYFLFGIDDSYEKLEVSDIIEFYLTCPKRPKLLAILSCAYNNYLPIAYSGLFQYFILTRNGSFENAETFLKGFLFALGNCKNIDRALKIGKMALMCRFEGGNQMDIYTKE